MTDRTELRPAETVAETVPTRHEAPGVAELRRLLDAYRAASGLAPIVDAWYAVARAALAALPALLDAAADQDILIGSVNHYKAERDALAADADKWQRAALTLQGDRDALLDRLAHMAEARDNARAEVERLSAAVERVRKWATACATQATDYDEDTEQQIEDGREVLRILDGAES